jgi:hypothetical protein
MKENITPPGFRNAAIKMAAGRVINLSRTVYADWFLSAYPDFALSSHLNSGTVQGLLIARHQGSGSRMMNAADQARSFREPPATDPMP